MNVRIEVIDECALVDELAALKAQVAPIEARMEAIKDYLKGTGKDRIDGTEHTAVIVLSEPEVLDKKRLQADLGAELWATYVSRPNVVTTLRLTARKTR
jgi:hypothetical protein